MQSSWLVETIATLSNGKKLSLLFSNNADSSLASIPILDGKKSLALDKKVFYCSANGNRRLERAGLLSNSP